MTIKTAQILDLMLPGLATSIVDMISRMVGLVVMVTADDSKNGSTGSPWVHRRNSWPGVF